jgi:hypothetical protein
VPRVHYLEGVCTDAGRVAETLDLKGWLRRRTGHTGGVRGVVVILGNSDHLDKVLDNNEDDGNDDEDDDSEEDSGGGGGSDSTGEGRKHGFYTPKQLPSQRRAIERARARAAGDGGTSDGSDDDVYDERGDENNGGGGSGTGGRRGGDRGGGDGVGKSGGGHLGSLPLGLTAAEACSRLQLMFSRGVARAAASIKAVIITSVGIGTPRLAGSYRNRN